jgi:hypothetical protein
VEKPSDDINSHLFLMNKKGLNQRGNYLLCDLALWEQVYLYSEPTPNVFPHDVLRMRKIFPSLFTVIQAHTEATRNLFFDDTEPSRYEF